MSVQEKLTTVAENVPKVYEAGVAEGEYQAKKRWWDSYIAESVDAMFGTKLWNDDTFIPMGGTIIAPYSTMFYNSKITNIKKKLADSGTKIDWSNQTSLYATFMNCNTTAIPDVDLSTITSLGNTFRSAQLATTLHIRNLREDCTFTTAFLYLYALVDFEMTGTIGKNGFNMSSSKYLPKASITNIINCLSTTTSGLSVTLSKKAVDKQFETSVGANDGSTSAEWVALRNTRQNWTVVLTDS